MNPNGAIDVKSQIYPVKIILPVYASFLSWLFLFDDAG